MTARAAAAAAVVALALASPGAAAATEPATGAVAAHGDAEYGAWLASECVACHRATGRGDGIPAIDGMPRDAFVAALVAYRAGARSNPVMRTVAAGLGDAEIAALAAHFAGASPP
jgi:cytochrome c